MPEKTISERIIEVSEEHKRLRDVASGKQLFLLVPQPSLNNLVFLASILKTKFGIAGYEHIIGVVSQIIREEIEKE